MEVEVAAVIAVESTTVCGVSVESVSHAVGPYAAENRWYVIRGPVDCYTERAGDTPPHGHCCLPQTWTGRRCRPTARDSIDNRILLFIRVVFFNKKE